MHAQPYSTRYKHKLSLKTPSEVAYMGDVTSYSDSSAYRIASSLVMQEARISDFPIYTSGQYSSFLLSVVPDARSKISNYLGYLRQKPHKCALVYFDSAGSTALLIPMAVNDLSLTGGLDGFRCCIVSFKGKMKTENDQPVAKSSAPTYSPIHPSSTENSTYYETQPIQPPSHGEEQLAAASHYNELKRERSSRHLSHIFHLRILNNLIKTDIINSAAMKAKLDAINIDKKVLPGVSVIDFGCGMGGDIFKWLKNPSGLARYVGVDIAQNSLKQFTERVLTSSAQQHGYGGASAAAEHLKVTHLVCADIGIESLTSSALPCHTWDADNSAQGTWERRVPLTSADQFDVASCQFAMHYMFQSAAKAQHFFGQISAHLKPGGVFIATTMDCRVVAEALSELLYGCFDDSLSFTAAGSNLQTAAGISTESAPSGDTNSTDPFHRIREIAQIRKQQEDTQAERVVTYRNDVGSDVLQLKIAEDMWPRLLRLSADTPSSASSSSTGSSSDGVLEDSAFGIKYTFTLHDSDEGAAVDAPEWVVPLGRTLQSLAAAHGMRLVEMQNFQDLAAEMMQNDQKLRRMESMHAFNYKGTMSDAEWRVARLYLKLVFVKDRPPSCHPAPGSPDCPPPGYKFQPSSPDGPPPPRFQPSSPDGPPPPRFQPSSPDGPPPPRFQPSSPDGPPPPRFQPSSPDGPPPPRFQPSSPNGPPPPRFQPSSPDGPPPPRFQPSSPDGPPPPRFQPSSPDGPPPGLCAVGSQRKRPLTSYESDSDGSPITTKKSRHSPAQAVVIPDFNPFAQQNIPESVISAPPQWSAARYGSDSEDETPVASNPFLAVPAERPFSQATATYSTTQRYGSDSEDESTRARNPFSTSVSHSTAAPPAQSAFAAAAASSASQRYGSDSEEDARGSGGNPFSSAPAAPVVWNGPAQVDYGSDDEGAGAAGGLSSMASRAVASNPYESEEEEEMDPTVLRLMRIRERAMQLAGGEQAWDCLEDDQVDLFMAQARQLEDEQQLQQQQ